MIFDETTLLEIEDYIQALDENVGLKIETIKDIAQAISKQRGLIKKLNIIKIECMKSKAELLIETLTKDSGRNVFTVKETFQLQEISLSEGKGEIEKTNELIKQFKKQFVLADNEWLC